jgi:gliding motility-associated-like protein
LKKKLLLLVFTFLSITALLAQVNLPLGLKAYYPFTGNANDVSGNNNNPIFNNATLTADRFGNTNSAYRFNGTSSYMRIPNSPSLNMTTQMSIALWVKPTGFYSGTCHGNSIVMKGDADFLTGNYMLRFDDNAFTNGANCSGSPVNTTNQNYYGANAIVPSPGYTPYIQQNQWSSVVYTTDGITAKLYVNCILKYSGPHGSNTFTNSYDLFFGRLNAPAFPYWLNGDLDEVRIYDRALNQEEVNVLGGCVANPVSCTNWLKTPSFPSSVSVGDLDVIGNKLTVEAMYSSSSAISPTLQWGKLVSKHTDASNVNYSLLPVSAEITTTNGYISTPAPCLPVHDKLYHVAMVYDGATLKFYRNGFLLSSVPWTGNLVTNDLLTTIASGPNNPSSSYQQLGYINEVRIWNVARTQAELQTYMNSSLPNPTTQTGLLGYYTFDNLLNKQGNAAYNGILNGAATINNTTPNCSYVADSCAINPGCLDSVRFTTFNSCKTVNFFGQTFPNATNIQSWQWYFGDGSTATGQNTTHTYALGNTNYTVKLVVTAQNGCKDSIIKTITTPLFITNVDFSNTSSCQSFNFFGSSQPTSLGIQNWQWYFGDGGTSNTQNTSHTYPAANTTYTVKLAVTDLNGCKDSISRPITTPPLFVADAGNDTAVCLAPIVTVPLNASAGNTYSWTPAGVLNNPSIRNPIATISATTKFFVTITNAAGCTAVDSVTITLSSSINPTLTINTPKLSICKGNGTTFTATFTNGGSNPIFQWYKNNIAVGVNSSSYVDNNLNDGDIIKCKLTSNISCASPNNVESNSIVMAVVNPSSNIRYPTVSTLYNQNVQLQARNFSGPGYVWEPNVGLNNNIIINPIFNYTQTKEYLVKINTPIGCTIVDTQLVVINGRKGLYVPKAFSPNNNGANDRLYPILVGIKQLLYFRVYNRWGILVFETNSGNPALGWTGYYKGQPQPVETYTWIAEAIDIDNLTIKKSGSTLLIR